MKIAINLRLLNPGKIGGMEGYTRNLLKYLFHINDESQFILFVTENNSHTLHFGSHRVKKITISRERYGTEITRALIENTVDLYFCPLLILEPLTVHVPSLITIPDVQHEFFPEFFTKEILNWRRLHFKASASVADAVLTLSKFSAKTISEKLDVSPEKVFPVYLAADEIYDSNFNQKTEFQVKQKYSLPDVYGFFPANTWPHKNHTTLLNALKIYKDKYGSIPKIVLTGAKDTGHKNLLQATRANCLMEDVHFLGYVPKNEIKYIYKNANFLVFPSIFEGFGMPVLEAMLSDCPVICSNATSLPEVAGEAALYFDPHNPAELAETIKKITSDGELRNELIEKGRKQARKFSWKQTAEETLAIFKRILSQHIKIVSEQPLVSIVTPSHNQGEFIENTILSVLRQDYANIEYIVMDGGSKDQTVEILKKYDKKIKWVSESDKGQADAVNKGFCTAKGKILGWLNSDDTYLPGAVRKVVDFFNDNPEMVMVYGNAYYIDKGGSLIDVYPSEPFSLKRLSEICFICQPTVFMRVDAFQKVGELDINLKTCMDFDFWIRLAKQFEGRIGLIDDYLATSRMYEENKTLSMREKVYQEIVATAKKHFGYIPDSWIYGYIADVINVTYMKRHRFFMFNPFKKLFYWLYIIRYLARIGKLRLLLANLKQYHKTGTLELNKDFRQFSDGWVPKRCYVKLGKRGNAEKIEISGKHLWPYDSPLYIKIVADGKRIAKKKITEKGKFSFFVDLPEHYLQQPVLHLILESNKTFIPNDFGINNDTRMLSFILDKVEFVHNPNEG